jgi:hypothetical protein
VGSNNGSKKSLLKIMTTLRDDGEAEFFGEQGRS